MPVDKDKKKYFKVQPTAPATSAYSRQDIKKRRLEDAKAASEALAKARERHRIKRSNLLSESLNGGLLKREYGQDYGLDGAQILAGGFVSQGYISALMAFSSCSAPLFAFGHRPDLGPSISDLWIGESLSLIISLNMVAGRHLFIFSSLFLNADVSIVYDDQLFTLRVNADKQARSTSHGCVEICHDFSVPAINNAIWRIERFGHAGTSTSISTNEACKRLAMTWLSTSAQAGIAVTAMAGIGELGMFRLMTTLCLGRLPRTSSFAADPRNTGTDAHQTVQPLFSGPDSLEVLMLASTARPLLHLLPLSSLHSEQVKVFSPSTSEAMT